MVIWSWDLSLKSHPKRLVKAMIEPATPGVFNKTGDITTAQRRLLDGVCVLCTT